MILWSLDVRSPPLDVVAVHRVGEPLVTPLVWRTLSCYLLPVILLSVARGVCVYSNASNHRCKLRDFLDSTRCDFAVSDQLYLEKSARHIMLSSIMSLYGVVVSEVAVDLAEPFSKCGNFIIRKYFST